MRIQGDSLAVDSLTGEELRTMSREIMSLLQGIRGIIENGQWVQEILPLKAQLPSGSKYSLV